MCVYLCTCLVYILYFTLFRGDRTWDLSCECTFTNLILQIWWKDKNLVRYNYSAVVKTLIQEYLPLNIHQLSWQKSMTYSGLRLIFFLQYSNLLEKVQQVNAGGSGKSKAWFLLLLALYCGNTVEIIKIRWMELLSRFCFLLVISLLIRHFYFINSNNFTICFIMSFHLA